MAHNVANMRIGKDQVVILGMAHAQVNRVQGGSFPAPKPGPVISTAVVLFHTSNLFSRLHALEMSTKFTRV